MPLGFLRTLFAEKIQTDPTIDWVALDLATPVVDLAARRVGSLKFGDPLAEARCFGKPSSCLSTHPNYCVLVYGRAGFRLDFKNNLFVYVAFFVGLDRYDPTTPTLRHCEPRERGGAGFSTRTTEADLIRALGQPDATDRLDADDIIVRFCRNGLLLEFELNRSGHLKRWNLFPEEKRSS